MPLRKDIKSVMVIGSGPIVIGQAAEFDYSGTQACRVLKAEGLRVILVNSNPATIMTDPEVADCTYIEPIITEVLETIIAKERPDALLPTLGGQTALNAAVNLHEADEEAVNALPPGCALLIVQRGPSAGARFLLDTDRVTAGRHPRSDIFLDDVTVSRKHCEFLRCEAGYTVRDAGSLNGTYVDRERVDSHVLSAGDEVQIGKFRLAYYPAVAVS